jgi:adenylate kinase family enzyme
VHLPSGRVYHKIYSPPKVPNVDDLTGEPLTQREDDNLQTVLHRLNTYHEQTIPVTHYYYNRNLLEVIRAPNSKEAFSKIESLLATKPMM